MYIHMSLALLFICITMIFLKEFAINLIDLFQVNKKYQFTKIFSFD